MKNIFKILTVLMIILQLYSCNGEDNSAVDQSQDNRTYSSGTVLKEIGEKKFILDSLTAPSTQSVEYFTHGDSSYLAIMSLNENKIVIFSEASKRIVKKIPITKNGPNSIGRVDYIGSCFISPDSIILANEWTNNVYIIDGKGAIIYKKSIPRDFYTKEGVMAKTLQPIIYRDKKIYIMFGSTGLASEDHTKRNTVLVIDPKQNSTELIFPRPKSYNQGNWGAHCMMDFPYVSYNKDKDIFIYSFPVDSLLFATNHAGTVNEYSASSELFKDVKPMSNNRMSNQDFDESVIYDYTTSHYYKIIYDPYRKYYYRFTLLGNTKNQIMDPKIVYDQQESVIILDQNFQKIGESTLPRGKYDHRNFFISKDGLCLLQNPKNYVNDSDMIYSVLLPKPKI